MTDKLEPKQQTTQKDERKWQKELKYNRILPYYDKLSEEADRQLAAIKTGLGHSILMREVTPGFFHWCYELSNYISLNSLRFSKEDHILFIKIFFQLVSTTDLELRPLDLFCSTLSDLLDNPDLLTRNDLELEWRPLYKLYDLLVYKNLTEHRLLTIPTGMQKTVESLISKCRIYFSISSTREILNEFRPLMCPCDSAFDQAITCLALFLPTDLPPEQEKNGYVLWLDEIIYWWMNSTNSMPDTKVIDLLSRLPAEAINHIDLNVYLPIVFSKILRSFEITLCGRSSERSADPESWTWLIVSAMGGENKVQDYITQLCQVLESYVHPSNVGSWQYNILNFLNNLASDVCDRLHTERHHRLSWRRRILDHLRLTDKQIDRFVSSLLPCTLSGMFATGESELAVKCLRYLSHLSPKLVVSEVLERMFASLDTLIEPHRLTQSLSSMIAVILPFVREIGPDSSRSELIPFMTGILPALDRNDTEKCTLTLQVLTYFFKLVSVADCELATTLRNDLTEEESDLCSETAEFESFANHFLDKMFSIVESFGHGFIGCNLTELSEEEESMLQIVYKASKSLLGNCSSKISNVVIDRLYKYVVDTLFERQTSAEFLGQLCAAAVATNPRQSFGRFLTQIFAKLTDYVSDEMFVDDKVNCSNVIWYLTLFFHITKCDGDVIVGKRKTVVELLKLCLPIKSRIVWNLISETVANILYRLTSLYISESCDANRKILDSSLAEYLPIRHWAETCKVKDITFPWHVPSNVELKFTKEILELFLFDQSKLLDKPQDIDREQMWKSLSFINHCLIGSAALLPLLDGPQVKTVDSCIDFSNFASIASNHNKTLDKDGQNIRNFVSEKMHVLMEFILKSRNSEPKCLVQMCSIFYNLLFSRSIHKDDVTARSDSASEYTLAFADKIVGKKSHTKELHYIRAMLQHETRLLQINGYKFTEPHRQICNDLLKLSTSHYVEVRKVAQQVFETAINHFWYSHRLFVDSILSYLKPDPSITDYQLKGALYVLLGSAKDSTFICRDWKYWHKIWPAIILAQDSKKESVITVLNYIRTDIIDNVISFCVKFEFPKKSLELAKQLWTVPNQPSLPSPLPDDAVIAKAKINERIVNEENVKKYYALIDDLVNLAKNTNLHWRHLDMAHGFLAQTIRMDYRFTTEAVKIFVRLLIHDMLESRNRGLLALSTILKMHRQKTAKLNLDVHEVIKKTSGGFQICLSSDPWPIKWGFRKDNEWLSYDENSLPKTEHLWNESLFIDKTHKGFYCWPSSIKINAPRKPSIVRTKEKLTPEEIPVYDAFSKFDYVKNFCRLMCVEPENEDDNSELSSTDILLFKGLFRTYGDSILIHFKSIIESIIDSKIATDSAKSTKIDEKITKIDEKRTKTGVKSPKSGVKSPKTGEKTIKNVEKTIKIEEKIPKNDAKNTIYEQKFAATFFVGLLAGAKHWPYKMQKDLWIWLSVVMRRALNVMPAHTVNYWYNCVSTIFADRDPRMLYWLVEILTDLAQKPMDTPLNTLNRIAFLQACLTQQQWRTTEIGNKILPVVKQCLAQPYQNLRVELGRILTAIFASNFVNVTLESKFLPANLNQFMDDIWSQLSMLRKEVESDKPSDIKQIKDSGERKQAILVFKTLMSFFRSKRNSIFESSPFASLRFLPLFCYFENEISDDDLNLNCSTELYNGIARCLFVKSENVSELLEICKKCAKLTWWKSRVSLMQMLQVSILSNLFHYSAPIHCSAVKDLVLYLLKDERLEVRDASMKTLSGLLHCKYFPTDQSLLKTFRSWTARRTVIERHAGVLGLSAVVKSCPYTVPDYLPDVIMDLCSFKAEKQPIKGTVEKTLNDFKRTHQDSWREHKERFTDDQLFVMTEVLISPTYYI